MFRKAYKNYKGEGEKKEGTWQAVRNGWASPLRCRRNDVGLDELATHHRGPTFRYRSPTLIRSLAVARVRSFRRSVFLRSRLRRMVPGAAQFLCHDVLTTDQEICQGAPNGLKLLRLRGRIL